MQQPVVRGSDNESRCVFSIPVVMVGMHRWIFLKSSSSEKEADRDLCFIGQILYCWPMTLCEKNLVPSEN